MNQKRGIGSSSGGICTTPPTSGACWALGKSARTRFQNKPTCSARRLMTGAKCIPIDTSLMGGFSKSIFKSLLYFVKIVQFRTGGYARRGRAVNGGDRKSIAVDSEELSRYS